MLSACRSTEVRVVEYKIPSVEAFLPPVVPDNLIAAPQTDADLLYNSVTWEYWGKDWRSFGMRVMGYLEDVSEILAK